MIYSNNHNDKKIRAEIEALIGPSYSFMKRIKMGGNGSPRLDVISFSEKLEPHFGTSSAGKFINIELREKGILIYIKNAINNYMWPIPYYQLTLFQSTTFNIHSQGLSIRIKLQGKGSAVNKFIKKLLDQRANYLPLQETFTSPYPTSA